MCIYHPTSNAWDADWIWYLKENHWGYLKENHRYYSWPRLMITNSDGIQIQLLVRDTQSTVITKYLLSEQETGKDFSGYKYFAWKITDKYWLVCNFPNHYEDAASRISR